MKIYIDFEASELEHKIISIGCINEKNEEFYSLVHTDDPITERIEQITGIKQSEIDNAESVDIVFSKLFDWCNKENDYPEFICYGDSDLNFVDNTFNDACDFKAAAMLGYLYLNMYDCSEEIKTYFCVNKTISLEKLAHYYDANFVEQNHNALDDAKLLKSVFEGVEKKENKKIVFKEYYNDKKIPKEIKKVVQLKGDIIVNEFRNIKEAVEYLKKQPNNKGKQYLNEAEEKIRKAAITKSKYFDSNWRII